MTQDSPPPPPTSEPAASHFQRPLTVRRLKWLAFLASIVFLVVLEAARHALLPYLTNWRSNLLMDAFVAVAILFFFGAVFDVIERMQEQLERTNQELAALRLAGLDVVAELSHEVVLQKVVDQARALLGARYGALSVVSEAGEIEAFLTSGVSNEERERIGRPPIGRGLLGVTLRQGERLRVADLSLDSRRAGFPAHHPPMRSLLAVPIPCKEPFRGNLYLCDKEGGPAFSDDDQSILVHFAASAAIAIDNAQLHSKVRELAAADERLRLAHEMHDGLAQVLAYVNTKAQAVQGFLKHGKLAEADAQLAQIAAAAREVYADVREGIQGLRLASDPKSDFRDLVTAYVERWQGETGVEVALEAPVSPEVAPGAELQLLRLVQEALANVRKHAKATRVEVALHQTERGLVLSVLDDGVGFDPLAPSRSGFPRFGLATMRERAESIGAKLTLDASPGRGTRLTVELPRRDERGRG